MVELRPLLDTSKCFALTNAEGRAKSREWLTRVFADITAALEPDTVFELGAHAAEFSRLNRQRLPKASFHAFEMNPHSFAAFAPAAEEAGVRYYHAAIGEASGKTEFQHLVTKDGLPTGNKRGSNSLRQRVFGSWGYATIAVPMVALDDFVRDNRIVGSSVMWIDLEGCAYEGLRGAALALRSCAAVHIEVEDVALWHGQRTAGDVLRHLFEAGFVPLARDYEFHPRQHNVICLRPDVLEKIAVWDILQRVLAVPCG